jgi:ABC-type glycerol-3-phosphate transport system permease component
MEKKIKHKLQAVDIVVIVLLSIFALTLFLILAWGLLSSLKSYRDLVDMENYLGLPDLTQRALLTRLPLATIAESFSATFSTVGGWIVATIPQFGDLYPTIRRRPSPSLTIYLTPSCTL